MDALMGEVIEGHIRFHVLDPKTRPTGERTQAAFSIPDHTILSIGDTSIWIISGLAIRSVTGRSLGLCDGRYA